MFYAGITLFTKNLPRVIASVRPLVKIPIRNIKMEYAADLLKNSNKSVTEIIEEINYSSISYFNHTFKNTFGVTPTQMRYRVTEQKISSDK